MFPSLKDTPKFSQVVSVGQSLVCWSLHRKFHMVHVQVFKSGLCGMCPSSDVVFRWRICWLQQMPQPFVSPHEKTTNASNYIHSSTTAFSKTSRTMIQNNPQSWLVCHITGRINTTGCLTWWDPVWIGLPSKFTLIDTWVVCFLPLQNAFHVKTCLSYRTTSIMQPCIMTTGGQYANTIQIRYHMCLIMAQQSWNLMSASNVSVLALDTGKVQSRKYAPQQEVPIMAVTKKQFIFPRVMLEKVHQFPALARWFRRRPYQTETNLRTLGHPLR